MPTSVRLDLETEALLERVARTSGRSKSWVVREALAAYVARAAYAVRPFELMAPFIGAGGTGRVDASERTGEALAAQVREKARVRRSR
jgi:hypothetical protein